MDITPNLSLKESAFCSVFWLAIGSLLVTAKHKSGGYWQGLVVSVWSCLHPLGWVFVPYLEYGLDGALVPPSRRRRRHRFGGREGRVA